MGFKRNRMKVVDQRTGRLAYAIQMVEDGEIRGLYVKRGEDDKEHPQKFPKVIPPDRATLARKMYDADLEGSQITGTVTIGFLADPVTFERQGIPSMSMDSSGSVSVTYTEA
jgi:hypothetical protein